MRVRVLFTGMKLQPPIVATMTLVPHGYQFDIEGHCWGGGCCDFADSHDVDDLRHEWAIELSEALTRFEKAVKKLPTK